MYTCKSWKTETPISCQRKVWEFDTDEMSKKSENDIEIIHRHTGSEAERMCIF